MLEPDLNSSNGVICGKNSSQRYWIIRDKINKRNKRRSQDFFRGTLNSPIFLSLLKQIRLFFKLSCVYFQLAQKGKCGWISLDLNPWEPHSSLTIVRIIDHRVFIFTSVKLRGIKNFTSLSSTFYRNARAYRAYPPGNAGGHTRPPTHK